MGFCTVCGALVVETELCFHKKNSTAKKVFDELKRKNIIQLPEVEP